MPERPLRATSLALLLLAGSACSGGGAPGSEPASAGAPAEVAAPEVRVLDLEELTAFVDAKRGTPLLVNFWARWCEPCVEELPDLVAVAEEHDGRLEVVGVSYDLMLPDVSAETTVPKVRSFAAQRMRGIEVVVFDDVDQLGIDQHFDLPGPIPVTLAIDAAGEIVDRQEGPAGEDRFRAMARRALGG